MESSDTDSPLLDLFSGVEEDPPAEPVEVRIEEPVEESVEEAFEELVDEPLEESSEESIDVTPVSDSESDDAVDPTPDAPAALSVSELNARVREVLEGAFTTLWVSGEVANWTRARSGHCYFTLKDESAQVRCVMWRTEAAALPMDPDEGMRLRVQARVTVYEVRGEYQLAVRAVETEDGEGLWRLAFERLRKKLESEGLLDPSRKRRVPSFPHCVGVVTSPTGAAIRDILTVIRRRAPWTRVIVAGARVQGEGSSAEVAAALERLAATGLPDVIIVGRGGGSIEDLWAFNEEPLARAVAASPVPVISAVGHEVDVTISDLVADLRAPTPSAAAEAAVPDRETLVRYARDVVPRLVRGLSNAVEIRRRRIREGAPRLVREMGRLIARARDRIGRGEERLSARIRARLDRERSRMGGLSGELSALSPLSILGRGYAVPLDEAGRLLRRRSEFDPGSTVVIRVVDGRIVCRVERSEEAPDVSPSDVPGEADGASNTEDGGV